MTGKIDDFYDMQSGVTTLHEVMEAYMGATLHPGTGMPTTNKGKDYENYLETHDATKVLDSRYVETGAEESKEGIYIYKDPYYDREEGMQPKKDLLINDLTK